MPSREMKVSDLIKILERYKKENGDRTVSVGQMETINGLVISGLIHPPLQEPNGD